MTARSAPKDYGPIQFPNRLGMPLWQFERALRTGLIPPADPATGRWPAAVVDAVLADLDRILDQVGTQPDVGANRAASLLSTRFGLELDPGVLLELDRMGLIPRVGEYKGHAVYDGRALEQFHDRAALQQAIARGRLLTRDEVAGYLQVRRADVEHLVRGNWLEPVTWVCSGWQPRHSTPAVPLFRVADLDVLLAHPAIDWEQVRATPARRASPLAVLSRRTAEKSHR